VAVMQVETAKALVPHLSSLTRDKFQETFQSKQNRTENLYKLV